MNLSLHTGEPDVAGPLAVFPLFGPEPRLEYVSYAEGAARGVTITELPGGASVNDVLVINPLDVGVLFYEGEEILGAQQNRTIDGAVLVGARSKQQIAVSCVESGRWDGRRHREAFTPSPQAAFPALRATKSLRMRERLAAGMEARADQGEVWQAVDAKLGSRAAPTRAMSDAYDGVDAAGIERRGGQTGALVAIGGEFVVLDYVSRADVWAALFAPLLRGYALDAAGRTEAPPPDPEPFLDTLDIGFDNGRIHFETPAAGGTGLAVDGELIQLSVYAR
jgi:ARG/rhodanese/phosphatase superfamily protein